MHLAFLAALVLGLRHATDPDHLTALSTLALSDRRVGVRRTGLLGLAWGLGHGAMLLALGFPLVLFGRLLPEAWQRGAEALVGLVIVVLAVRLLHGWRQGRCFRGLVSYDADSGSDAAADSYGNDEAAEVPGAEAPNAEAPDADAPALRSPAVSFSIGLLHGIGGSAGVTLLLLASAPEPAEATAALVAFALGTALSMAWASATLGWVLTRQGVALHMARTVPWIAAFSCAFGAWYFVAALWV